MSLRVLESDDATDETARGQELEGRMQGVITAGGTCLTDMGFKKNVTAWGDKHMDPFYSSHQEKTTAVLSRLVFNLQSLIKEE